MPKIVDHEQRRADLADAVLRVIATRGDTAAVTNKDVAKEAGCSTGLLAHYFSNQHDLLIAALRRAAHLQGKILKRLESEPAADELQRLQRVLESVLPLDDERLALNRIFLYFYAEAVADDVTRREVAGYLANWRRTVRRMVVDAQATGSLPEIDPDQLAVHLVGLSDGVALHAMLDPEVLALVSIDPGLVPRWLAATWQLNRTATA
ncbi:MULTISPECIES: TetR/AcrR family transcriptional regulator [unclassified Mycolicibacterium]|uniref:TetR/AcrR family transcriptional regulator n=1 Tax=unclassified Mycolicibacterium TaxID=2636767 RepID=UPI001F4C518C|nr:TetR/AcrR family transcriptional regulator [Mycolicibacterium sp. YH-1]UNB50269.1 TetR/AcrR family transcriptional regulator [Mycolicibacterium sp. YH-1]